MRGMKACKNILEFDSPKVTLQFMCMPPVPAHEAGAEAGDDDRVGL